MKTRASYNVAHHCNNHDDSSNEYAKD